MNLSPRWKQTAQGAKFREIEFTPLGGAYANPNQGSCYAHRDAAMLVRHTVLGGSRCTHEEQARLAKWADTSWNALDGFSTSAAYQGYAEVLRDDWIEAAYGTVLPRLLQVKKRYDPAEVISGQLDRVNRAGFAGGCLV